IFSSFYNLLPEAKEQLSSELSIFAAHSDAFVMIFFFCGIGTMAVIHWIMHRFDSGSHSPGIENSGQFLSQESRSSLPQYRSPHRSHGKHVESGAVTRSSAVPTATSQTAANNRNSRDLHDSRCTDCMDGVDEESDSHVEEHYNDSEYVDEETASLLKNAYLHMGKTPSGRLDDTPYQHLQQNRQSSAQLKDRGYDDDDRDSNSIEVVIADQKDKILKPREAGSGYQGLGLDVDLDHDLYPDGHESSGSTSSQKPFAPVNKNKKAKSGEAGSKAQKSRSRNKKCTHHPQQQPNSQGPPPSTAHSQQQKPLASGHHSHRTYGTLTTPNPSAFAHEEQASHLRRTSFPHLNQRPGNRIRYSSHDNLDHAPADDREHADLTEIGIQTALTIAVHKFPEGMITFLSTTADPCLGLSVFIAIAVHNLIEGYLIAYPLFVGLHSRTRAFALAAVLGGLSQPLGAMLGWFILRNIASMGWQVSATGVIYALVAGMMASIAVNGMWPQAVKCAGRGPTKVVQTSFFAGITIMGVCQAVMGTKCDA
ncbi:hypothetical protein BGW38_006107, partial [Lunasporangiospora selenospora]